jgi:ATP-dependent DNA helicase RecQ
MVPADPLFTNLRDRFGLTSFRAGQLEVIRAVLAKKPTLAVMPTGLGKSLCFQLPALVVDGLTLVVSPLVALMKDQVDQLRRLGIAAAYLNSTQSDTAREQVEADLRLGRLKLLYIAPERFGSPSFRHLLTRQRPAMVAVDEAHCVSEWGHAFRPDYGRLGQAIEDLKPAHLVALTATATADVRADIIRSLRMQQPFVSVSGFDRSNIHLEVHELKTEAEKRDTLVGALATAKPAIIYSATRRQAAALATHLVRQGVLAAAYHGGLETNVRNQVQERFLQGELDVVVGTNAFGLGINKADVRLVMHSELPRSLEVYYQEIGRAGRDGRPATAAILFAQKDLFLLQRLLEISTPPVPVVSELHRRLSQLKRPLGLSLLSRNLPGRPLRTHVTAAMAYLESAGLVERQFSVAPLALQFARGVNIDGESAASRLAQLAKGARGGIDPMEATRALGLSGVHELHGLLNSLEVNGVISRPQRTPEPSYVSRPDGELLPEHLRQLRVRAMRDQARLRQMVDLARRTTCRRSALLWALGEAAPAATCQGCDVCSGHKLVAVRSRLPPGLRPGSRIVDVSPPLVTVNPRARDTSEH